MKKLSELTPEELKKLGKEWYEQYYEVKKEKHHMFKYTTWSIITRQDLTNNEKIALSFINAASPIGGIMTGVLQGYLGVTTPTIWRILKSLTAKNEIQRGEKVGLWVVTETEKLF